MGISLITVLEIFTNPGDLQIIVGQKKVGSKYAIGIFRGPGHNFKPMITFQPFAKSKEEAIKTVEEILVDVNEAGRKEFGNRDSLPSQYLNPNGLEVDQAVVLNPDLIGRILDELRQHGVADTYKMIATID